MTISEELELDVSPALAALRDIDDSFSEMVSSFRATLADAVQDFDATPLSASVIDAGETGAAGISQSLTESLESVDASPVQEALTTAGETGSDEIGAALTNAVSDFDAEPVSSAISEAGASGSEGVTAALDGAVAGFDAGSIGAEIEASVQGADTHVDVTADVGEIAPEIEREVGSADTEITITADLDLSGVEDELEGVDFAIPGLEDVSQQAEQATSGLEKAANAAGVGAGIAQTASTAQSALGGSMGGVAKAAGPYGAAVAGVTTLIGGLVKGSLPGIDANARYADSFGDLQKQIDTINVGSLNVDLNELTTSLGGGGTAVKTAISNYADLAGQLGFTKQEAADFAEQFIGVSARVTATRPEIQGLGEGVDRTGAALLRGGSALAKLGIGLDETAVKARGQEIALAHGREEANRFDLVVARTQLTAEKFGDTLGKDVADGAESGTIKMRALKAEMTSAIAVAGKPLVEPFTKVIEVGATVAKPAIQILAGVLSFLLDTVVGVGEVANKVFRGDFKGALEEAKKASTGINENQKAIFGTLEKAPAQIDPAVLSIKNYVATLGSAQGAAQSAKGGNDEWTLSVSQVANPVAEAAAAVAKLNEEHIRTAAGNPAFVAAIEDAQSKVASYAAVVNQEVPGVGGTLGKLADDHVTSFAKIREAFAQQLKDESSFMTNIQEIIRSGAPEVAARVLELGVTRGAALAAALAQNKDDQLAQLEAQALEINEVERKLSDTEADAKIQALAAGIAKRFNIPKQAALDMIRETGAAAAGEAKPQGEKTGISFADGTGGGVISRRGDLESAGRGAAQALGSAAGTAHSEGQDVGNNFVSGLVGVLRAGATGAIAAAARAAGAAMKPAANAGQHAKSPSKDGKEVGANFINGVAIGFEERKAEALRKLEEISAQFARAAGEGLAEDFGSTRQITRAPDWINNKDAYLKNARDALGEFGDALTVTYDGELRAAAGFEDLIQVFEDGSARWATSDYWNKPKELETNIRGATAALKELQSQNLMTFQTPNLQAFSQANAAAGGFSKTISGTGAEDNSVHISELNVTLHTIYDPSDPMSRRRAGQEIEAILSELAGENR